MAVLEPLRLVCSHGLVEALTWEADQGNRTKEKWKLRQKVEEKNAGKAQTE